MEHVQAGVREGNRYTKAENQVYPFIILIP